MAAGFGKQSTTLFVAFAALTCPSSQSSVKYICKGMDVILWLPTGYSKSMCYEVLPSVLDVKLGRVDSTTVVVVVSPLAEIL